LRSRSIAALAAIALLPAPAAAQPMQGYAASATRLYAGPLRDFPVLRRMRRGSMITVYGCLRDWTWCDVTSGTDRGWIAADALRVNHKGRRRAVANGMGVTLSRFLFGTYWDGHYSSRQFYRQRQHWQLLSDRAYRPEWGEREKQEEAWGDTRAMEEQHRLSRERGERTGGPIVPQYIGKPYRFPDHGNASGPSDRQVSGPENTTKSPQSASPAQDPD